MQYIQETLIPATNEILVDAGKEVIDVGIFLLWLGLALTISCSVGFERSQYWTESRDDFAHHPDLRKYMSRHRFDEIQSAIRLSKAATVAGVPYRDKFVFVREFLAAWNANMQEQFIPSFLMCLDESMVQWLNKWTCPGWVHLPRKPHPFGNEYHTIACAVTHIIFQVELVEGKDRPTELPKPEFEAELGKMGGLIMRMTKPVWYSNRIVIMDSAFCQLKALISLQKHGVYATVVIKKRRYWPKYIDGDAMDAIVEKDPVGTAKCLKGTLDGVPFTLVALRDTKHVLKLASTCGSMEPVKETKRRRDPETKTVIEFHYPEMIATYYKARHAVDDNNNMRQGSMGLEEGFPVHTWNLRQFIAMTAVSEVNSLNFYNHRRKMDDPEQFKPLSLIQYRRLLARALVENPYLKKDEAPTSSGPSLRSSRTPGHELVTAPLYTGKWRDGAWAKVSTQYLKRKCSGEGCTREQRTYCACDPHLFWCDACFYLEHLKRFRGTTN